MGFVRRISYKNPLAAAALISLVGLVGWLSHRSYFGLPSGGVARIGFVSSPPYTVAAEPGHARGPNVDLFEMAAKRLGVRLVWVKSEAAPERTFPAEHYDLWHALHSPRGESRPFYYSAPWARYDHILLAHRVINLSGSEDGRGLRLAIQDHPIEYEMKRRLLPLASANSYTDRSDALSAVCRGEADAVMLNERVGMVLILDRPKDCRAIDLAWINLEKSGVNVAVAAAPAFENLADRLSAEIARMALDGEVQSVYERYGPAMMINAKSFVFEAETARAAALRRYAAGAGLISLAVLSFLAIRLRNALVAARAADQAKSDFLATMSHEIRTPLHGIVGMISLLRATPLQENQAEYASIASQSAAQLQTILNDVLDLARIEAHKLKLESIPFDVNRLLHSVAGILQAAVHVKQLAVSVSLPDPPLGLLLGDEGRLRQILMNLVVNAEKFTPSGSIELRLECIERTASAARLRFSVRDTGIGIAPEVLPRLFAKFEQADASTTRLHGGSGLGLAIARSLVEMMEGTIGVESELGRGSNFWIELPVNFAAIEPAGVPERRTDLEILKGKVLVAEDNAVNRRLAVLLLDKIGLEHVLAANGEEAVKLAAEFSFAAILMDCQMPVMDGFEATALIRSREAGRRTPIVALTANASSADRERCLAAGMDDFIPKPFTLDSLRVVLARWVPASHADQDSNQANTSAI